MKEEEVGEELEEEELVVEDLTERASGLKAGKRDQCWRSIFSVEFQEGWVVRKLCLGPTISPVKKVVRVGWSSVRPAQHFVIG